MIGRFGNRRRMWQYVTIALALFGGICVVTDAQTTKPKESNNPSGGKVEKTEAVKTGAASENSFDTDDSAQLFEEDKPIAPGKYTGEEGKKIASRVAKTVGEVNRGWFYAPEFDVKEWGYTLNVKSKAGDTLEKKIYNDRKGSAPWPNLRGITYIGVATGACEFIEAGQAEIKGVEVTEKEIKIHFVISENGGAFQMIGNGLDGQWLGFFQRKVPEGVVYVNAEDYTLIGVKMPRGAYEKYGDYVDMNETLKAPRRIEIVSGDLAFDMKFKVYKPGVWLLDRSVYKLKKKEFSTAVLGDVRVNGESGVEATPAK